METPEKRLAGWLRNHKGELVLLAAIFLASTLSFGAGWLANREFVHSPIVIEKCSE